jgi:glycosidase
VEAFSRDADWMSNVVLIAKSTYVWLDQLSKKYQRPIHHLSDVPDEELDRLGRWGFTGLWLIGVWERSRASQTIKQIMGNPEAMASAYSVYDYEIANDLGGKAAYEDLKERAWKRGLRLSADMVPNHMGIFSRWVVEHPHWFIQMPYPPFPVYQFTGANLSDDSRVVLQIEDGYWQHRDAAVVFKRIDTATGEVRYIYHGNDGTNMPWNDTAQLNFLLPEVREAVIQTILHVARQFPIIRFDAAMTLAKRHYSASYPQPVRRHSSRAEHGLPRRV